jgi:ArsR family transcriptional regulator
MPTKTFDAEGLEGRAQQVAGVLRALANERRLLILCSLIETGEATVSSLAETVGLSQRSPSRR